MTEVVGNIVDIPNRRIFPGIVRVAQGKIISVEETPSAESRHFILPGFIDAHVHIESSMLPPSEFARLAVLHGTVATVSDPHEIANVLGIRGIRFMIENAKTVPFHFFFGASPCVPATTFETAGAAVTVEDIHTLFEHDDLKYLSEMMNFPGVLGQDPDVMAKIAVAKRFNKPIDGHAPGLRGEQAHLYALAGISTDHECVALAEAIDQINAGMKILIREGSAAKNFEALHSLIRSHPSKVMFCCDDHHPNDLVQGHINRLVSRAVSVKKHELFDVLYAACLAPIAHYGLEVGQLRVHDSADFIVVEDLASFQVLQTYVQGQLVAENGKSLIEHVRVAPINRFDTSKKKPDDFSIPFTGDQIRVIDALDGQLVTGEILVSPKIVKGCISADVAKDILKIAVVNRYHDAQPAVAFIRGFGLRRGALASSIAHDSHNIIAIGCNDEELCQAVNLLIEQKGGIAAVGDGQASVLPLPLAGLMSTEEGWEVAKKYSAIDERAKELGSTLHAPFMTLSFMALLVIPALKLSDKGLFDVNKFAFTSLGDL